jgi:hypothetical protein
MNLNPITIEPSMARTIDLPEDDTPSDAPLPEAPQPPGASRGGRANGKIARLPKPIRDQINHWLLDGVSYPDIIQRLGEHGKDLTLDNISQWKKRAFQDWLVEQAFVERTRARQETPGELVRDFDATEVNHAALQLGALTIFEALRDLGPGSLDKKLGGDAGAFVRLLNALARTSRETMMLQKYREACAKARAALYELKDPKRKLTDSERRAIVMHVDDILGISHDDDDDEPESAMDDVPTAPISDPSNSITPSSLAAPKRSDGGSPPASPASEAVSTTA